jgi:hypothetical protein
MPYNEDYPPSPEVEKDDAGGSIAFPDNFWRKNGDEDLTSGFAWVFHEQGYTLDETFLARHFSIGLLQHLIFACSGIMIGRGYPVFTSAEYSALDQSKKADYRFIEDKTQFTQFMGHEINAMIYLKPLRQMIENHRKQLTTKSKQITGLMEEAFAIFAPVLEQLRTCQLLHGLGADFMRLRAYNEEHGMSAVSEGIEGIDEKSEFFVFTSERATDLKKLIFNLVQFYVDEAKRFCEGKTVQAIAESHPPSEFTVRRLKDSFKKKEKRFPTEVELDAMVRQEKSATLVGVTLSKHGGLRAENYAEKFNPNELPLPGEIITQIEAIYGHIENVPHIDLNATHAMENPPYYQRVRDARKATDFNPTEAVQAIYHRMPRPAADPNITPE